MKSTDIVVGETYLVHRDTYTRDFPGVVKEVGSAPKYGTHGVRVPFVDVERDGRKKRGVERVHPRNLMRVYTEADAEFAAAEDAKAERVAAAATALTELLGVKFGPRSGGVDLTRTMSPDDAEALIARLRA